MVQALKCLRNLPLTIGGGEPMLLQCEKDIRQASAAGAARVSVDFTEGRLATRNDPRNPWTGRNMLPHFIELNNRVLGMFQSGTRTLSLLRYPVRN
jgi:hypothetical protein